MNPARRRLGIMPRSGCPPLNARLASGRPTFWVSVFDTNRNEVFLILFWLHLTHGSKCFRVSFSHYCHSHILWHATFTPRCSLHHCQFSFCPTYRRSLLLPSFHPSRLSSLFWMIPESKFLWPTLSSYLFQRLLMLRWNFSPEFQSVSMTWQIRLSVCPGNFKNTHQSG